jgi:uncharacterized protein DUF3327
MARPASTFVVALAMLLSVATATAQSLAIRNAADDRPDSPRIAALAEAIRGGDTAASGRFWREMEGKAPLVEPIPGDAAHFRVTFIWRGTNQTKRVFLIGGIPGGDEALDRLERTDLWYLTERIPARARFGYLFLVDYPKMVPGEFSRNPFPQADPLNPSKLGGQSIG